MRDPLVAGVEAAVLAVLARDPAAARAALARLPEPGPPLRRRPPIVPALSPALAKLALAPVQGGPEHTHQIRRFVDDRWCCRYCGRQTIFTPVLILLSECWPDIFPWSKSWCPAAPIYYSHSTSIDHLHPKAHGGLHSYENLRTACYACQTQKNDLFLEQLPGWNELPVELDSRWDGLAGSYLALQATADDLELFAVDDDTVWGRAHSPGVHYHRGWQAAVAKVLGGVPTPRRSPHRRPRARTRMLDESVHRGFSSQRKTASRTRPATLRGIEPFLRRLESEPSDRQARLRYFFEWAAALERSGAVTLRTLGGPATWGFGLVPVNHGPNLAEVWNQGSTSPYLYLKLGVVRLVDSGLADRLQGLLGEVQAVRVPVAEEQSVMQWLSESLGCSGDSKQ